MPVSFSPKVLAAFALAFALTGPAFAQTRPPAPLPDIDPDADTCLLDDRATPDDVVAACTRLIENAAVAGSRQDISDIFTARAQAQLERNQPAAMVADVEKALQADPKHPGAHFIRGGYYIGTMKYDLAVKDLDAVLAIFPDDAEALFERGVAKFRLGNKAGADADFAAAKAIQPTIMEDQAKAGLKP